MDPVLVVTNAEAGGHDAHALETAVSVLRGVTDVEVVSTSRPGELDGVLHRRGGRLVVVAGGDGSVHAVVAALHRRNELAATTLGLIPLGTGNDFARGLGVPLDAQAAAEHLVRGELRRVDLLVDCAGEVVVNAVHVGVGADAAREAAAWKRAWGRIGYVLGAARVGLGAKGLRLRVEVDDRLLVDLDRPVLQVAIGNGSTVGGGAQMFPDAVPHDGYAAVVAATAVTPLAKVGYVVDLARGRHPERNDVLTARARTVRVSGQPFCCNADGEVYGPETHRQWRVEPGAITMLLS